MKNKDSNISTDFIRQRVFEYNQGCAEWLPTQPRDAT